MATRTDIKPCDVFVSWTGKDRALKDRIVEYLEGRGLSCIDSDSACAGDFTRWSREAVSFGTVFLPIITENTAESRYMPMEAEEAKKLDDAANRILPVATSYEVYTANGFDFHVSESAVIFGEAFSDERLAELYEKVVSLINNCAFQAYTHSKSYIKLALLYREKQTGRDLSLDYDAIYLPRRVKDEVEGDGACPFDEALMAGREVLYLHGPAGCGKSQYISEIKKKLPEGYLTVSLACAKAAMAEGALDTLLYEEFCRLAGTRVYSPAVFAGLLQSKHLVLVLDGLDEIHTEAGTRRFVERVEAFYLPRKEKITLLFTGRNPDDVKHLALGEEKVHSYLLEKLTEEEIRRLSANLFLSLGSEEKANEFYLQVKSLQEEIRSNPLLLSQLAIVYENTGNIPETVVGILDAISVITFRMEDERAWEGIPKEYHGMLKNLAVILKRFSATRYRLLSEGEEVTTEGVLRRVLKRQFPDDYPTRAGFLKEYLQSRSVLVGDEFAHKMFLEYFTAVSYYDDVFEEGTLEDTDALASLFSHYRDSYWSAVLQLFLVKADSLISEKTTKKLYQAILKAAKVKEYTLLFDTCRDLLRHRKTAETVLLGDILDKCAKGIYPPYGPLFYYVPTYELYESLALALAENISAEALALVRDVCWIYGCYNTLAEITDKVDGRELFEKGKQGLKGIRIGLCELFYLGKTEREADDGEIFPRCFSLAEATAFLETGCGVMAPIGDSFEDEMSLFSFNMLNELDGEWIGLLSSQSKEAALNEEVYSCSGMKITGLVWKENMTVQIDVPYFERLKVFYLFKEEHEISERMGLEEMFKAMEERMVAPSCLRKWWRIEDCVQYFIDRVVVPDGVYGIEDKAFADCSRLTEVYLPESVQWIGTDAFAGCRRLTEIFIPDSVEWIASGVFAECINLMSIHIPDGVTEIGASSFAKCSKLARIHIPEGVTEIGDSAFYGCSDLTEIYIPDSLTRIGMNAFKNCSSLIRICIPESVTEIGSSAFEGCSCLTEIRIPDSVTEIGSLAFSGCTSLREIYIPDSVTRIGRHIFSGCNTLNRIDIPDNLLELGWSQFEYYTGLKEVQEDGNEVTQYDSTSMCVDNITEIHIPDGITKIGFGDYRNHSNLFKIYIPDSVTEIGWFAFNGCTSLREIYIPDSVTEIGSLAFSGCTSLREIYIPDSVTEIGGSAFEGCSSLPEIHIPESVTEIGGSAFKDCCMLTEIEIPKSVKCIGHDAFRGCVGLKRIRISYRFEGEIERIFGDIDRTIVEFY